MPTCGEPRLEPRDALNLVQDLGHKSWKRSYILYENVMKKKSNQFELDSFMLRETIFSPGIKTLKHLRK